MMVMKMKIIKSQVVPGSIWVDEVVYDAFIQGGWKDGSWRAIRCPVPGHKDEHPSLTVMVHYDEGKDVYTLAISHKSANHACTNAEIYTALGVPYYSKSETAWDYYNAEGVYSHSKVKFEEFDAAGNRTNKKFRNGIRQKDGSFDYNNIFSKVDRIPYNLPAVYHNTETVFVVEGEKDVDRLSSLGRVGTTGDNGAESWRLEYGEVLKNAARIIIIPDHDEAGQRYLKKAAYSIIQAGNAEVYQLELPGLKDKEDLSDWLDGGHTVEEFNDLVQHGAVKIDSKDVEEAAKLFSQFTPPLPPTVDRGTLQGPGDIDSILAELNSKYFYTRDKEDKLTQSILTDLNTSFAYASSHLLKSEAYSKHWVIIRTRDHKKRAVNIIDYWKDYEHLHGKPPRIFDRIEFDPSMKIPGIFNTFTGFPYPPEKHVDISDWLEFVDQVICSDEPEAKYNVHCFMADIFQNPATLPYAALVLRGDRGVGKGTFTTIIKKLVGNRYSCTVTSWEAVTGSHNDHLASKLVIDIDDATWGGRHEGVGILNNLITGNVISINPKFFRRIEVKNYARVIIQGNDDWLVPKAENDRRFFVLDIPIKNKRDRMYYVNLVKRYEDPQALSSLMHHYRTLDISNWDIVTAVQNRVTGRDMLLQRKTPLEEFLLYLYQNHTVYFPKVGLLEVGTNFEAIKALNETNWPPRLMAETFYLTFCAFCDTRRLRNPCDTQKGFSTRMAKMTDRLIAPWRSNGIQFTRFEPHRVFAKLIEQKYGIPSDSDMEEATQKA